PYDETLLSNIFRMMHTIKGTCGFIGMSRLEKIAHSGENILGKIRDKELSVSADIISLILQVIDKIKIIVEELQETGNEPEGNDDELIRQITQLINGSDNINDNNAISNENINITNNETAASAENITQPNNKTEEIATEHNKESQDSDKPHDNQADTKDNNNKQTANNTKKNANSVQSLRINIDVLEHLMEEVGELVLTRNQLLQMVKKTDFGEFNTPLQRLNKITSEIQDTVMKTRMQPINTIWGHLPRLIRDLSIELEKKINLKMVGEETEIDRQLLTMIKDPLTHMIRNSCDHGIETPERRLEVGKNAEGTIILSATHEGGYVIIEIVDDGNGINIDKIKQIISDKNIADEEYLSRLSDKQIFQYIFHPGFSTADKVTSVSGRGVGMDVVKTNIENIGGVIEINSIYGKGSTFIIKIPLTLAIMPVLIVQAEKQRFAIPQINIVELVKSGKNSGHFIEMINNSPVLRLRNQLLPLIFLKKLLNLSIDENEMSEENLNGKNGAFIVICMVGGYNVGIIVDMVYDTEEIVVKPINRLMNHIELYGGNTILGDGNVIMILDINAILKTINSNNVNEYIKEHNNVTVINKVPLLKFRTQDDAPKLVPLELISRLEEINSDVIEFSDKNPVVQYRNNLMRLVKFDNTEFTQEDENKNIEIIVFEDGEYILGLIVESIEDIIEVEINKNNAHNNNSFLQSIIIDDVICDLVDINYFFNKVFPTLNEEKIDYIKNDDSLPLILLVDDSPFFRKFIPPTLQKAGYSVITSPNGAEAVSLLKSGLSPKAIVTDMNMPVMDGAEFIEQCKNDKDLCNIPIFALSSHLSQDILSPENSVSLDKLAGYINKTNYKALLRSLENL
ncbi:MAG: hybrid sensor histidine kinase/response regulator, partial [Pseudomonadota bacterium]